MAFTMDGSAVICGDSTTQLVFTSSAAGTKVGIFLRSGEVVGVAWVNGATTTLYDFAQLSQENPHASFGPLASGDKIYVRSLFAESRVVVDSVNV